MSWNPRPFGTTWAKPGRCRCPPVTSMALLRDIVENLETVLGGEGFADVKLARDLGPRNLDLRHVHRVSPHHQGLAGGIEAISAMSGGVARKRQLRHAGDDSSAAARPEPFAIGFEDPVGGIEIGRRRGRPAVAKALVRPERDLVLVHDHFRAREGRLSLRIQKAARVVGMDVGHEHRVEVVGLEARGAQILGQPPHGIDGGRAAARIDENRIAVSLDDKGVDRQPRRPVAECAAHQPLQVVELGASQNLETDIEEAVVDRRDQRVADAPPVDARRLLVGLARRIGHRRLLPVRDYQLFGLCRTLPTADGEVK